MSLRLAYINCTQWGIFLIPRQMFSYAYCRFNDVDCIIAAILVYIEDPRDNPLAGSVVDIGSTCL